MKIKINTPSTLIVNAINTYLEVVENGKHIDYDTVWLEEGITVPIPAVADSSNIMTDDPDENIDIMHDYFNCFAGYEEIELITNCGWLENYLPTKEVIKMGVTSIPTPVYSVLEKFVADEKINSMDIPFIISCLVAFVGRNDKLGRHDENNSMENWFVSRFKFDIESCFNF